MSELPTVFAVLTPPGAAAIAAIALVGPRAWAVVRNSFRPTSARPLPDLPPLDRYWHGQFGGPPGDAVVLSVRQNSTIPWVELHCHGGVEVVRLLTQELSRQGVTACSAGELLRRAGVAAMTIAAAVELSRAATVRTAGILLDQFAGAFPSAILDIDGALATGNATRVRDLLADLARFAPLGRHLVRPWRVAVAGAPNVGKSSLVNALAGFQRSVVTPLAGTTRDVVSIATAIDGWPIELLDTAGLHPSADELEGAGIARARAASAAADLCLWVVDATSAPVWPDAESTNIVRVVNKSDLPAAWDTAAVADAVVVSARSGDGLAELGERVSRRLVPSPPPAGAAIPFTPELADRMTELVAAAANGEMATIRTLLAHLGYPMQPS